MDTDILLVVDVHARMYKYTCTCVCMYGEETSPDIDIGYLRIVEANEVSATGEESGIWT